MAAPGSTNVVSSFSGWYFPEGQSARATATISVSEKGSVLIQLLETDSLVTCEWSDLEISSRIGNTPRRLTLPDGAVIQTTDNSAVDQIERHIRGLTRGSVAHGLERLTKYTPIFVAVVALFIFAFVRWGIPIAAEHAAEALPRSTMNAISARSMHSLDARLFKPSNLKADRREELRTHFNKLVEASDLEPNCCRLLFRRSAGLGANAFALPDGTIVLLDGLVSLATDDRQIIGVMAHELGHVEKRHGMRSVLQGAFFSLVVVFVAGDLSSAAELALAIPAFLIETGYSRDFEREADRYGAQLMQQLGHDPKHLADFFNLLTGQCGAACAAAPGWLSTHPSSEERVKSLTGPED